MTIGKKTMTLTTTKVDTNTLARLKILAGPKPVARYLRELSLELTQDNPPSLDDLLGGESLTDIRQRLDRIEAAILSQEKPNTVSLSILERIKGKSVSEKRKIFTEELARRQLSMTEEHITPDQVMRETLYKLVSQATPEQISEWQLELSQIVTGDKNGYIRIPRNMPVGQAIELIKKELEGK